MKNKFHFSLIISVLIFTINLLGQDSVNQKTFFPEGISLEYGIGNYAVTDEYISQEKYSGHLPYYSITWSNQHADYAYHLKLDFRNSSVIKNNNVSTDIYQFSLNQGFNYTFPKFTLFGKDAYAFVGPATELFFYYNQQNIAVSGFDYSQSFAMLISGGISSQLFYMLSNNFNLESSLDFSLLSMGFRMVDSEEEDISPVKILTIFSGTNLIFKFGPRYYLFEGLSIRAAYIFHLTRISLWEPLLSASDNVVFSLSYGF